jgi:hypothetical protein
VSLKSLLTKWLPAFPQSPVALEIFVHLSAKAIFGIVPGDRIQFPPTR